MKFIHLVSVLGLAAAFGVAHALPARSSHALAKPPSQASVPPWLAAEPAEADPADPQAGLHAPSDATHSGLYADDDPHAGVHVHDDDPHAGVHVHDDDPHAGLYAEGDPHAGLHAHDGHAGDYHEGDPHAGVYPAPEPVMHTEDPYQQVGLAPPPEVPVARLERSSAPNGHSVEEIYAGRQKLAGQKLRVRGTVVKLNEGILGKTYLHLRDGSGSTERGDDDLTATTTEAFELGETVELEGELSIDQDVGAGYVYPALLTQATRVAR